MGTWANDFVEYENNVEAINRAAENNPEAFVLRTEDAYHQNIRAIAEELSKEVPACRLVMLAGPSSSGKTTTAHLLADALRAVGTEAVIISLDDFYRGEYKAPLLPSGKHDYESIEALNLPEIQQCLYDLVEKSRCSMPVFNFEIRMPYPHRRPVSLGEHEVAVVEGLHALNPLLINKMPALRVKKIYISVKQGVFDGARELLGPNDVRLLRRIVRDHRFRGTRPETTLDMWPNVMDGERKYIKPFRKDADFTINSLHAYELCVLKRECAELLHTVPKASPQFETARKMALGLEHIVPLDGGLVPKNSILREFIGGGIY